MTSSKKQNEKDLWDGLSQLARSVGPYGVPFTAVFMGNVLVIFLILFLSSKVEWLWLVIILFAGGEIVLGLREWKEERRLGKS